MREMEDIRTMLKCSHNHFQLALVRKGGGGCPNNIKMQGRWLGGGGGENNVGMTISSLLLHVREMTGQSALRGVHMKEVLTWVLLFVAFVFVSDTCLVVELWSWSLHP